MIGAAVIGAAVIGAAPPSNAGGVDFNLSDQAKNAGPGYFGVAVDQNGAPVPDAKITVTVTQFHSIVIERTDSQGHFFVQGFDRSIDPNGVNISCSKDGYQPEQAKKTIGTDPSAPVEVVCNLHKS